MPVSTTPIPSVAAGDYFAEWIISANLSYSQIHDVSILLNAVESNVGDLSDLTTTDKSSVVAAFNELRSDFTDGTLLQSYVGKLSDLETTNKNSIVDAINELDADIGALNDLATNNNSSIVDAINDIATTTASVGDLTTLDTTEKTSIVGSINEIVADIGNIDNLNVTSTSLSDAINEVNNKIGSLSLLTTTNKDDVVDAINDLQTSVDDLYTKTAPEVLNDLDDVNAPSPVAGNFLKWNGTEYITDDVVINDVENLSVILNQKSETGHTHNASDISDFTTETESIIASTNPAVIGAMAAANPANALVDIDATEISPGVYIVSPGATGSPNTSFSWIVMVMPGGSANAIVQLAIKSNTSTDNDIRVRHYTGSAWTNWHELFNYSRMGSGSGWDADLLDGHQASYFAVNQAAHRGNFNPDISSSDLTPTQVRTLTGGDGFYTFTSVTGAHLVFPSGWPSTHGVLRGYVAISNSYQYSYQIITGTSGNRMWMRRATSDSAWTNWEEFWHSGNLANPATLTSVGTWSAGQKADAIPLTDGTTVTPNLQSGNTFILNIGGNRTLGAPTNQPTSDHEQDFCLRVVQDGTGSRTLAYNSYWRFAEGETPVLSTTAGALDILVGKCYSGFGVLSIVKGVA